MKKQWFHSEKIFRDLSEWGCTLTDIQFNEFPYDDCNDTVNFKEYVYYLCKCTKSLSALAKEIVYCYTPLCSSCEVDFYQTEFKAQSNFIRIYDNLYYRNKRCEFYCNLCNNRVGLPLVKAHRRLSKKGLCCDGCYKK